jgi:hypothetical protein
MIGPRPIPRDGTALREKTASPAFHTFFHSANGTAIDEFLL